MEMVLDRVCASCGSHRQADDRFCLFCGDVLVAAEKRNGTSPQMYTVAKPRSDSTPAAFEYAGFWLRFLAGAVDMILEALGALLLTLAIDFLLQRFGRQFDIDPWDSKVLTGGAFILIWAVGSWLYCAFAESSSWRATIGKRLLGLQVISLDGGRMSFGRATERHFMKFLSLFCLMIGFLMPAWTARRQALHDMPCDAIVIRAPQANFSLRNR
jgi:uncharacterized RDD family membrane protein YckC